MLDIIACLLYLSEREGCIAPASELREAIHPRCGARRWSIARNELMCMGYTYACTVDGVLSYRLSERGHGILSTVKVTLRGFDVACTL